MAIDYSKSLCIGAQVTLSPNATEHANPMYHSSQVVSGLFDESLYASPSATVGASVYVLIELENSVLADSVVVSHYPLPLGRTYNHTKTEVSENGVDWFSVYDYAFDGLYVEIDGGIEFTFEPRQVRYIRDTVSGNNYNGGWHWIGIALFNSQAETYSGAILTTQGLIAHYPLVDNIKELSGEFNDLELAGSSPATFVDYEIPNINNPQKAYQTVLRTGMLRVVQPMGVKCISLFTTMPPLEYPESNNAYATLFAFNQLTSTSNGRAVVMFSRGDYETQGDKGYYIGSGYLSGVSYVDDSWWEEFAGQQVHLAVQESADGSGTEFYINSVLAHTATVNIFSGWESGRYFTVGGHYYLADFAYEITRSSNVSLFNRRLTDSEIEIQSIGGYSLADPIANLLLSLSSITWSNRETKAQANPQPIYLVDYGIEPVNNKYVVKNNPFHNDVMQNQQGDLRKYGYIESTTEISGIPVGFKRVMLFTHNSGAILDETVSDAQGNYRFDSLLLGKKYMITAQYGNADENTPPDYSATSVDWQSPTPYK